MSLLKHAGFLRLDKVEWKVIRDQKSDRRLNKQVLSLSVKAREAPQPVRCLTSVSAFVKIRYFLHHRLCRKISTVILAAAWHKSAWWLSLSVWALPHFRLNKFEMKCFFFWFVCSCFDFKRSNSGFRFWCRLGLDSETLVPISWRQNLNSLRHDSN